MTTTTATSEQRSPAHRADTLALTAVPAPLAPSGHGRRCGCTPCLDEATR